MIVPGGAGNKTMMTRWMSSIKRLFWESRSAWVDRQIEADELLAKRSAGKRVCLY